MAPFERALDAGVASVMPSYNSVNGEPSHGSAAALRSLLREDLGFNHITLAPGETATVTVQVPTGVLGFYRPRDGHVVESGTYRIDVDGESTSVELPER